MDTIDRFYVAPVGSSFVIVNERTGGYSAWSTREDEMLEQAAALNAAAEAAQEEREE